MVLMTASGKGHAAHRPCAFLMVRVVLYLCSEKPGNLLGRSSGYLIYVRCGVWQTRQTETSTGGAEGAQRQAQGMLAPRPQLCASQRMTVHWHRVARVGWEVDMRASPLFAVFVPCRQSRGLVTGAGVARWGSA